MARKKVRQKGKEPVRRSSKGSGKIVAIAAVAAVVLFAAYSWWQAADDKKNFQKLAAAGKGAPSRAEQLPSLGNAHLQPGQAGSYADRFPTSGAHAPNWSTPGFYDAPQPKEMLVHALEHGNIVIYYDQPDPKTLGAIRAWTDLYRGQWDGVIAVPAKGLGARVVLTAWTRRLAMDRFEPAAAAAFVDAYRGRGPENPVR
ncbi:MAG: DUF3105 domain-containing protein [bacterium]|nr:DUF3105 domain-containing protein [bacterium]